MLGWILLLTIFIAVVLTNLGGVFLSRDLYDSYHMLPGKASVKPVHSARFPRNEADGTDEQPEVSTKRRFPAGSLLFAGVAAGTLTGVAAVRFFMAAELSASLQAQKLAVGGVFCLLLFLFGFAENAKLLGGTQGKRQYFAFAPRTVLFAELIAVTFYLTALYYLGDRSTAVLFPFGIGYVDFGWLYYPLTAGCMLLILGGARLLADSHGAAAGAAGAGSFTLASGLLFMGDSDHAVLAMAVTGGCLGFLFWNVLPDGFSLGRDGANFLGAIVCVLGMATGLEVVLFLAGGVFLAEKLWELGAVGYYKIRKRPALKGRSLHALLQRKCKKNSTVCLIYAGTEILLGVAAFYMMVLRFQYLE